MCLIPDSCRSGIVGPRIGAWIGIGSRGASLRNFRTSASKGRKTGVEQGALGILRVLHDLVDKPFMEPIALHSSAADPQVRHRGLDELDRQWHHTRAKVDDVLALVRLRQIRQHRNGEHVVIHGQRRFLWGIIRRRTRHNLVILGVGVKVWIVIIDIEAALLA